MRHQCYIRVASYEPDCAYIKKKKISVKNEYKRINGNPGYHMKMNLRLLRQKKL